MQSKQGIFIIAVMMIAVGGISQDINAPGYGQMLYWKSLDQQAKGVFLFAYLSCSYELLLEFKAGDEDPGWIKHYQEDYVKTIFAVFNEINKNSEAEERIISWIDAFYSFEMYQDRPFLEAVEWSYNKYKLE